MIRPITSISQYPYSMYRAVTAARAVSNTPATVSVNHIPPAQPEVPVEPVKPVQKVPEATTLDHADLLRRLETDPAAMAVRSRIQYVDGNTNDKKAADLWESMPEVEMESAQDVAEDAVCETCKNRKYQDGSDDPGVSFKNAAHIAPDQASSMVRSHEYEHVSREQDKAQQNDRKVVSQSVTYNTAICPECGKVYVAGGTTRTVTAKNNNSEIIPQPFESGTSDNDDEAA